MTKAKMEELKKLITVPDYKEESYQHLTLSELNFLRMRTADLKMKNMTHAQNGMFFKKREEFFFRLILIRLQKAEALYVIMAQATGLPYVFCDPETCNDQVWLFTEEEEANRAADAESNARKLKLRAIKMENKHFLPFYTNLFFLGVNELLINRGIDALSLPLEQLVKKPDFSALPENKRPIFNPALLLTAAYFAQGKALPAEIQDKQELLELEEEMVADLVRGKVLVPVQLPEGETKPNPQNMRFPLIKLGNGKAFQPVCSDSNELQRFCQMQGQAKMNALTVDGEKLSTLLVKEADGVFLNPTTVKLAIPKSKL